MRVGVLEYNVLFSTKYYEVKVPPSIVLTYSPGSPCGRGPDRAAHVLVRVRGQVLRYMPTLGPGAVSWLGLGPGSGEVLVLLLTELEVAVGRAQTLTLTLTTTTTTLLPSLKKKSATAARA